MPKSELGLLKQPASVTSQLFEDEISDSKENQENVGSRKDRDVFEGKESGKITICDQISGRVPASNGVMGLVNGMDSNVGAPVRMAFFKGLREIGLGFVESIYDNAGGEFELPKGAALALKYEENTHEPGSYYVRKDEVRKACDEAYLRDGRDIIWIETQGVSEIGAGSGGTLPLGALADASANLNFSGLIRYRRLEPFESASGSLLRGQAFANTVNVPITATLARRMPPGGEFEFVGECDLSLEPELLKPVGYKNEITRVGASAKLGGAYKVKRETSISVQRLPFGDEVMVKIAVGKSTNKNWGAELVAGMELDKKRYEKLPEMGRGFIKYLLTRLNLPDAPKFVKHFLQSKARLKSRHEDRETEIARYVFDLSDIKARKAYEALFTRFSLNATKNLVSQKDGSVRTQRAGEKVRLSERGASASIGKTKLILLSALEAEREGK